MKKGMPEILLASLRFIGFLANVNHNEQKLINLELEKIINKIIEKRNEAKKVSNDQKNYRLY